MAPILLVLALAECAGAAAEPGPIIRQDGSRFALVLPPAMADSLVAAVPGFVPWSSKDYTSDVRQFYRFTSRQAPWAVVGDFDGDGHSDVVVAGHADSVCAMVCLWGGSVRPAAQVLERRVCSPGHDGLDRVLMYVPPGLQHTNFSDDTLFVFTDAFLDYIFEKAGETWYWKEGEFHQFISSD